MFRFGANFRRDLVSDYDSQIETVFPELLIYGLSDFTQGEIGPSNEFYGYNSFNQAFTSAPTAHLALYNLGVYVQDEFQATPRLKLTFGGRVDRTGNPLGHNGVFSLYKAGSFGPGTINDPYNSADGGPINPVNDHPFPNVEKLNFQPRAGFNFSIDERTEIRGGAGVFSDLYPAGFIDGVIENFPNYNAVSLIQGNIAPSGASNVSTGAVLANSTIVSQFSSGGSLATTAAALSAQGVSANPPTIGAYFPSTFRVPEYLEYSLQLQRQFRVTDALSITYAGSYGYNEVLTDPFVNPSSGFFNASTASWQSTGAPMIGGIGYTPPNADFGKVTAYTNNAHSNYSGLQVNYKHNSHGFTGQASYTWSHSLDVISNAGTGETWNGGSVTNQITPNLGRGSLNYSNSDYDVRHNISGDAIYDEPFKFSNKFVEAAAGGWVLGAKSYWHTGEPFSIETSQTGDYPQLGSVLMAQTAPGVSQSQIVNLSTKVAHSCVEQGTCLNPGQFESSQNTFGNLRRNAFYGPHYVDTDLALTKKVFKREGMAMSVGANAYNILNKANFANPGSVLGTSSFGVITSTVAAPTSPYGSFQGAAVTQRVLQVHGRFTF